MALGTTPSTPTAASGSTEAVVAAQFNNLCDVVRALAAKLDADSGVNDTDYAAAVDAGVAKVTDNNGVEF